MMNRTAFSVLILTASLGLPASLGAQTIPSGPEPGTALTKVMAYAPVGADAGRTYDAAARIGDGPGALLFVHEITRNTAPVLRGLDRIASERRLLGFRSTTLVLGEDRTALETRLKNVNRSLRLAYPLVLSLDGAEGPGNYALERKCTLTLVLADKGKVVRSVGFTDTGQKDVATIEAWINEMTGPMPTDPGDLRKLIEKSLPQDAAALRDHAIKQALEIERLRKALERARNQNGRMRGGRRNQPGGRRPNRENPGRGERGTPPKRPARQGKAPDDAMLMGFLRDYIRRTNDDARVDEVYKSILTRAAESEALKAQAIDMFKLMLSFPDNYGTAHAQKLAREYLEKNAKRATKKL